MSDNQRMANSASASPEQDQQRAALPAVDVFEDAGGITLLTDMPGVPKKRLELKVDGEALSIEGAVQNARLETAFRDQPTSALLRHRDESLLQILPRGPNSHSL